MVGIKAGLPTPPPNLATSPEQTTLAAGSAHDTLSNADKLEISYDRIPAAKEPVVLASQVSDEASPQTSSLTVPTIVSRHWHDHSEKKLTAVSPDRRSKIQQPKNGKSVDRAKTTVDIRPCRRLEGFTGLLRALNLSPRMRHVVRFVGGLTTDTGRAVSLG
jgi:hypothetical protein